MAKEDIPPLPEGVPKKRKQLEQALDVHIAMWLASDNLTPSERRRLAEEKARRRSKTERVVVGFTGTREGLTPQQREGIRFYLEKLKPDEAHHGDCVNGDERFHKICEEFGISVVIHPPDIPTLRAFCKNAIRVEKPKPYLERNKDIVKESTIMLAAPKELNEPEPGRGQGTWSTVRYARDRSVPIHLIKPDWKEA